MTLTFKRVVVCMTSGVPLGKFVFQFRDVAVRVDACVCGDSGRAGGWEGQERGRGRARGGRTLILITFSGSFHITFIFKFRGAGGR